MIDNIDDKKELETNLSARDMLEMDEQTARRTFNKLSIDVQGKLVLSAPWTQRMKLMLLSDTIELLVQSLPEEEIYWTIKEIGAADALPIISHTSYQQLQYIIDIDCWKKDRIDIATVRKWLKQLLRCREAQVLEWITSIDNALLTMIFKKLFSVHKIRDDIDLAEDADYLPAWTIDGVYYFQFVDDEARLLSIPFLHLLYQHNSTIFYSIMESISWALEAELEEESLHDRQARIAEKGFPELEEALEVYQYVRPDEIPAAAQICTKQTYDSTESMVQQHPVLRYSVTVVKSSLFIHDVMQHIAEQKLAERIQREMIHVTNKVMIADGREINEAQDMQQSLSKVAGYINIGLESVCGTDITAALKVLGSVSMQHVFRYGYSQALYLRDRAQRMLRAAWIPYKSLRAQFYDTPWGEALAGVERLRPQFFEGLLIQDSLEYREFRTINEINRAAHAVDMVAAIDYLLFDCLSLHVEYLVHDLIHSTTRNEIDSLKARPVFLTILARHIITGQTTLEPLTKHELNAFLSRVWQNKLNDQQGANPLQTALYDDTLQWITSQYTVTEEFVPAVEEFISSALNLLQNDCASLVNQKNIDCRYISSLLIRKES